MPDVVRDYFSYFNFLDKFVSYPHVQCTITKTKKELFVLNSQHGTK